MMKKSIILLVALTAFFCVNAQTNLTPAQILGKAMGLVTSAKGVKADFIVSNSGYTGHGSVSASGNKFTVTMPDAKIWYNGKDLYTYNQNTNETTVVEPTPEELAQTNPFAYISSAQNNYSVSFSTVKKAGMYVLELIPAKKNGDVKRVTLTLRKSDFVPQKIVVEPRNGNPVSAEITSFKTGINMTPGEFEYPKSKYPKTEIIDLR